MTAVTAISRQMRIGFIGAGRLATGLAMAFARQGLTASAVASRSSQSSARFAAAIPGCRQTDSRALASQCDLVFITVPDDSIAAVADGIEWQAGTSVVHCSGATELSALKHALERGAQVGGFHPMQAFTDPAAAASSLPGCTISIEAAEPLQERLRALAQRLGCRSIRLPPGCRSRYHASNAYASQFVNVLLKEAAHIWNSFGLTEDDAVRALLPLLKGITASIETQGIANGMPGPVSRGDVGTIRSHIDGLAPLDSGIVDLYRELARRTIPLALERGSIDAPKAAELQEVLRKTP